MGSARCRHTHIPLHHTPLSAEQLVPAGQHGRSLSSEDTAEPVSALQTLPPATASRGRCFTHARQALPTTNRRPPPARWCLLAALSPLLHGPPIPSNPAPWHPQTVIFGGPTVGGVPLDFCLTFGAGCGEEAARYFCQALQGFANVSEYQLAGQYANRTYIPSSGTFCEDKNCQTFESITCTGQWLGGPWAAGGHTLGSKRGCKAWQGARGGSLRRLGAFPAVDESRDPAPELMTMCRQFMPASCLGLCAHLLLRRMAPRACRLSGGGAALRVPGCARHRPAP